MTHDAITISPGRAPSRWPLILPSSRTRLQIVVFPLFVGGCRIARRHILRLGNGSCASYLPRLALGVPAILSWQAGGPGVDLFLSGLGMCKRHRKSKQLVVAQEGIREERPVREDPRGM